jgi:hypothetical protein
MIIDKTKYEELKNYSIVRLTQIGILANNLYNYLKMEVSDLSETDSTFNSESLLKQPDLMEIASKEGYRTPNDFKKLAEIDPQRVEKIFQQSSLLQSKLFNDIHLSLFKNLFPHITWSSLFLIAMSHFEYSLILISNFFQNESKSLLTIKDISGQSTFEKFTSYCLKVLRLEYDFSHSIQWSKVKNHQKVRNLIVHNNGIIDDSNRSKSVKQLIDSNQISIKYNDQNYIEVSITYLETVIEDLQNWQIEFFRKIE